MHTQRHTCVGTSTRYVCIRWGQRIFEHMKSLSGEKQDERPYNWRFPQYISVQNSIKTLMQNRLGNRRIYEFIHSRWVSRLKNGMSRP